MSTPRRRRKDQDPLSEIGTLATVPTATGHPRSVVHAQPSHEEIARRAYHLYERRGGEHGHDWDDWFEAEHELRQTWRVVDRSLASEDPYVAA